MKKYNFADNALVKRGDIFWAYPPAHDDSSVQAGARPAIVVSNDMNNRYSRTLEVVFLTTQPKKSLPTHVPISSSFRQSTALCEQTQTIGKDSLGNYIATCSKEEMEAIDIALGVSLGLEPIAVVSVPQAPTKREKHVRFVLKNGFSFVVECFDVSCKQSNQGRLREYSIDAASESLPFYIDPDEIVAIFPISSFEKEASIYD